MARDPICGKFVDEQTAQFTSEQRGNRYYFCREACKKKFDENPMMYPMRRGSCCG